MEYGKCKFCGERVLLSAPLDSVHWAAMLHRDCKGPGFTWFTGEDYIPIDTTKTAIEVREIKLPFSVRALQETYQQILNDVMESYSLPAELLQPKKENKMSTPTPTTNVKHQQEIINAYLGKKDVEVYISGKWVPVWAGQVSYIFDFVKSAYRIKPEPREFYLYIPHDGTTPTYSNHAGYTSVYGKTIKVREVLED